MVIDSNLRIYKPGEVIFSESEPGDAAYIIETGNVELSTLINGKSVSFARLSKGDMFGEMSLIDNQMRSATATAADDVELIVIPAKYIQEKIDLSDKLVAMSLRVVLERYREMRGRLEHVLNGNKLEDDKKYYNYSSHDHSEDAQITAKRLQAENNLKNAFEQQHLELFYQPIIDLKTQKVAGCEALVRWRHPERGMIPPGEFIGLAEESGLIVPIGRWIVEEACRARQRFAELGDLYVSVNLSGKQFEDNDLSGQIEDIYQLTAVNAERIKLEITETLLMANPLQVAETLFAFKEMGSQIAIDDFGTGYSSFSYLHRFPIDTLKIDQSFVFTMRENPKSLAIVRTLCLLAKSLEMNIVAEGIEHQEDVDLLTEFDADYGQGYHFSRPLPENEFIDFLKKQVQKTFVLN